jgi:hypothetical protein
VNADLKKTLVANRRFPYLSSFLAELLIPIPKLDIPTSSVADPNLGSGIRCLSDPWIRDQGWVKIKTWIRDEHPGSYFRELRKKLLG